MNSTSELYVTTAVGAFDAIGAVAAFFAAAAAIRLDRRAVFGRRRRGEPRFGRLVLRAKVGRTRKPAAPDAAHILECRHACALRLFSAHPKTDCVAKLVDALPRRSFSRRRLAPRPSARRTSPASRASSILRTRSSQRGARGDPKNTARAALSVRFGRESLRDSTVSRGGEVPPAQHCRFHRFCCCLALSRATRTNRVSGRGRYPAVSCSPCTGSELLPTHHSLRLAGSRLSTA